MRISFIPYWAQDCSQICRMGTPRIGSKHFGVLSVRGLNRVPCPAASKNAFKRRLDLVFSDKFHLAAPDAFAGTNVQRVPPFASLSTNGSLTTTCAPWVSK